ncbi:MAG: N-acetylmuramoyl-L-alanine amidase AmiB [Phycisphaerae bacterium]|nr:N-acetylmuramoyl-L-alanine amidase AmiB [Phycisphaerae bacterium]
MIRAFGRWIFVFMLVLATGCQGGGNSGRLPDPVYVAPRPPPVVHPPLRPAPPTPPPPTPTKPTLKAVTIVVDAGHGGKDPGAQGVSKIPEKQITLAIANEVASGLKSRGAKVISTRTTDKFIELDDRAASADRHQANVLVSIHADSSPKASVSGSTIYIARNAKGESEKIANSIAAAFRQAGIPCLGIRRAGFRVLVGHSRPAVLIETGYLTNHAEAQKLAGSEYQSIISEAIVEGLANHFGR